MPSLNGFAAAPEGVSEQQTNGNGGAHAQQHNGNGNGNEHRPKTPVNSAMALTEYSVCPSPPSETAQTKIKQIVPPEFLLPDGYPDVRIAANYYNLANCSLSVPTLSIRGVSDILSSTSA